MNSEERKAIQAKIRRELELEDSRPLMQIIRLHFKDIEIKYEAELPWLQSIENLTIDELEQKISETLTDCQPEVKSDLERLKRFLDSYIPPQNSENCLPKHAMC